MKYTNLEMTSVFYVVKYMDNGKWVELGTYHLRREANDTEYDLRKAGYVVKVDRIEVPL